MNETKQKDLYFVAVKLFLRDQNKLLITHDIFGSWDLPGGRIKKDEFNKPLESIIDRKVKEELGTEVKYKLGIPLVFFRVEREEHNLGGQKVRIFAIGYDAKYLEGEVKLGDHHDKMKRVDLKSLEPDNYFTGGWLEGVNEYMSKLKVGLNEKLSRTN